ncbi:MAG TPA: SDR family NAD(P)-dependent oxidoreductase [Candidatus Competibacteraceae bacterium]|nr:SDR family NAD(P)-dependent oxidoreductase [Candidatus Competibacteraceae bacterium]
MAGAGADLGRVLVTGAGGFIGRHLVDALCHQGVSVRALLRQPGELPPQWEGLEVVAGDVLDPASLARACQGVDTVLHAAGYAHAAAQQDEQAWQRHWQVNAAGTRALLQAALAAGAGRFVFLSSVKAMGDGGRRCIDEDWPLPPATAYGQAKRAAEEAVLEAGREHGLHVVNLRLALVYGPGVKGNLARMIEAVRRRRFPPLPEVGNRRSLVDVRDVAQAVLLAARYPAAAGRTYIVSDGRDYSSREILDLIRQALGRPPCRWAPPLAVWRTLARLGDAVHGLTGVRPGIDSDTLDKLLGWACYSSARIRQELGFQPRWTLAQALAEMVRGQARC